MIYSKQMQVSELSIMQIEMMFSLYSTYYGGTSFAAFCADLKKKDHVLLLACNDQKIRGFSTIQITTIHYQGKPINVLFSGDTIVEYCYWGKNDLAQEWVKFAAQVKNQAPDTPLYWFLIVKGHRTYRYLSLFSNTYYPAHGVETPRDKKQLIDDLSTFMFGKYYDAEKGILHFPDSRGHLQDEWAEIPLKDLKKVEVQFFLERNPNYKQGDELVCLCELTEENLKPHCRRIFAQHAHEFPKGA